MKVNQFAITFALIALSFLLSINLKKESLAAANVQTVRELPARGNQLLTTIDVSGNRASVVTNISPVISFEKTVCYLGDVGQGTKNTCEFRFTNTGRGLLKIGQISRICGCTVFQLDKKEYAPNEIGIIKVIYTAAKSTGPTQKSI